MAALMKVNIVGGIFFICCINCETQIIKTVLSMQKLLQQRGNQFLYYPDRGHQIKKMNAPDGF
jgi:hypothetical protein